MKEIKFLLSNHEVEMMRAAFNDSFLKFNDDSYLKSLDSELDDSGIARVIIWNYAKFYEAVKSTEED